MTQTPISVSYGAVEMHNAPFLPVRMEVVGRCAAAQAGRECLPMHPGVRAVRAHAVTEKWVSVLKELVPRIERVGFLNAPTSTPKEFFRTLRRLLLRMD
jgi:hypothetical protein